MDIEGLNKVVVHKMFDVYPLSTDICCWWCCHKFKGAPVPYPKYYDELKNTYKCTGIFCSFSCAKSYILQDNFIKKFHCCQFLKVIARLMGIPSRIPIIGAPPRSSLKMFGGEFSIEEFRSKSVKGVSITTALPLVCLPTVYQVKTSVSTSECNDGNIKSYKQNDSYKMMNLKRAKPLPNHKGTLEHTMGLTITKS